MINRVIQWADADRRASFDPIGLNTVEYPKMSSNTPIDTLRLSDRELDQLIADLEKKAPPEGLIRRALKRWTFSGSRALLTLSGDLGNTRHFIVASRNLSAGGLTAIHGGYIHIGTRCMISMKRLDRTVQSIAGRIVRCSHMQGNLHDLAIQFDKQIDPKQFVDFGGKTAFNVEHVDLSKLQGSILVIEDSLADQRLLTHYFSKSDLEISFARNAETGLSMLSERPDLIFVDYHLQGMNGLDFVAAAKSSGFAGPMIVLTGDTSVELRKKALSIGAAELLHKPCPKEVLHQAAAEYLIAGSGQLSRGHGPLLASAEEVGLTLELLNMYVDDLRRYSGDIQKCIAESDLQALRVIAMHIRSTAKGHGYNPVGQAATELLRSLDATGSVEESASVARRLDEYCRRAKATE